MAIITLQVLDGVDKGRVFANLTTPVTIGREEGNHVRLNDERISRFHAKVQQDQNDIILTDLESTNGTRVNGNIVQIRRLRIGDCIALGRSVLLFGSNEEIATRLKSLDANARGLPPDNLTAGGTSAASHSLPGASATVHARSLQEPLSDSDLEFDLEEPSDVHVTEDAIYVGNQAIPPLPLQMSPSQAARLAEMVDFLHQSLAQATERVRSDEETEQISLDFTTWQRILAVEMILARYLRAIGEPDSLED
jgi:pSer/pThr/pTyr-binding forkhead associated (FHA) protein